MSPSFVTFGTRLLPLALICCLAAGAELKKETVDAWHRYVREAEVRAKARVETGQTFLWATESEDRMRRLRSGEVLVEPAAGDGKVAVPNGLIHDWLGAVYLPDTTLEEVFARLDDYERYRDFYRPTVVRSKLLAGEGNLRRYSMCWLKKVSFVTAVLDADYETRYYHPDAARWYSLSASTRVQEINHYGRKDVTSLPEGTGSGYVWKLFSIARFEQVDRGVVAEMEAIALSRDVPASLGWLVHPIVRRVSRDGLSTTLIQTRTAVGK